MKLVLATFCLAVCASIAVAQEGYKCKSPKVWYAHFMEFNPSRREARRGTFYYDEDNERVAIREDRMEEFNTTYYHEIFLHKEGVGYRYNNVTKDCQRFHLDEPFPVIGPYLSDTYQGEAYIGSSDQPKDGVRVQIYSGKTDRGSFVGVWIPTGETEDGDGCIPVSESYTRATDRTSVRRSYYDVRLGILDPDVFTPCF